MKVDYFCNSVLLFRRVQGKEPSLYVFQFTSQLKLSAPGNATVHYEVGHSFLQFWEMVYLFRKPLVGGAGVGEGGGTAHASPCNRSGSAPLYNVRRSSAVDRRAVRRRTRQLSKRRGHIVSTSFSFTLNRFCWLSTLNRQIFFFSADVNETRGLYFHFCYLTYFHKFRRIQSFEI